MEPTVHTKVVPSLFEVLKRLDIDGPHLWASAGLPRVGHDRLPLRVYMRFLGVVSHSTGDRDLGLHIAGAIALADLSLLDLLGERARHASCVGDAMRTLSKFQPIWMQGTELLVVEDETSMLATWVPPSNLDPEGTFVDAQESLFLIARLPSQLLCRPLPDVVLTMPRLPESLPPWAAAFQIERDPSWTIRLPHSIVNEPVPSSPTLLRALDEAAERELARVPAVSRLTDRLLAMLRPAPHTLPLDEAARSLGLGPRTLQRGLAKEGMSFRAVRDVAACRLAKELLLRPDLDLEAVAAQVGLSSPAALVRSFKRWTGMTPGAWRAQA